MFRFHAVGGLGKKLEPWRKTILSTRLQPFLTIFDWQPGENRRF